MKYDKKIYNYVGTKQKNDLARIIKMKSNVDKGLSFSGEIHRLFS